MSFNDDAAVVLAYFAFMVTIGMMTSSSASNYFRGGGKMLWWMVGASAFMTQFSAWIFTGAAGKAYSDGLTTPVITDDTPTEADLQQRAKLGFIVTLAGIGMLLTILIPNLLWGRLTFLGCALGVLTIGLLLHRSARPVAAA